MFRCPYNCLHGGGVMAARFLSAFLLILVGVSTNAIARPWTPADDTNITSAVWYDASDASTVLTSGTSVTNWLDKSGNGRHASQATSSLRPQYQATALNGKPVVLFDGADDVLPITGTFSMQNIFIVLNNNDVAKFGYWDWPFGAHGTGSNYYASIYAEQNTTRLHSGNIAAQNKAYLNGVSNNLDYVDFSPFSSYKIFAGICSVASPSITDWWEIGNGDGPWNGGIAEIVVTTGTISTEDRQKIEGYLAWKWGLKANLPGDHPYKTAPPQILKGTVICIR